MVQQITGPDSAAVPQLAKTLLQRAGESKRFMVAIAGPPAAGKSTLATALAEEISGLGEDVAIVPMDGFHYDDGVLRERGLSHRKGAPETFDFGGFLTLLRRISAREADIAIPIFDRTMELSRAAAAIVGEDVRLVLVEGNYLLLDEAPWSVIADTFDLSIYLEVPLAELKRRLLQRWYEHGRDPEDAHRWVETNDLLNLERVVSRRRAADIIVSRV